MQWVKKHKVLTVILVFFGLVIISAAAGGGEKQQSGSQASESSTSAPAPAPTPPAAPKFDAAAFYDKVQTGMTKAQVVEAAAGNEGRDCTSSETAGIGKFESCNWYDGGFSSKFVSVMFTDDKVSSKSKYGF